MKHYKTMEKHHFNDYEDPFLQSKNRLESRVYTRQYNTLQKALNFDIKDRGQIIDLNGK
jgi:hypothetical protein